MEKSKKEPKRKPKYGLLSCVGYMYRYLWKNERRLVYYGLLVVPITVIAAALALYTPSLILDVLGNATQFSYVALVIVGLLLAGFVAELLRELFRLWNEIAEFYSTFHLMLQQQTRYQKRDWFHQYSKEVQELDQRGAKAVDTNHAAGVHLPMDFAAIVATILNFLLFGGVVAMLHPLIVVLLAFGCAITYAMTSWERKSKYQKQDENNAADKRRRYLNRLSGTFKYGKDIRLYRMQGYLHSLNSKVMKECQNIVDLWERKSFLTAAVNFLVVLVRDGLAYGFLIYKAVAGEVDAAQFVLYFSAITALSGYMNEILTNWAKVAEGSLQISDFREDLEIEDKLNHGKGIAVSKGPFTIEFKDVCYKYPMGEKQKLLLARLLYKNPACMILDEPTAALDPIAEAEVYARFNDIASDKTSVFISHRLSSCKFCDEIAVFHKGHLVQLGSHDQLVADTTGKYHELWHAQAQYYTEKTA